MFGWPIWFLGKARSILPFAQVGLVSTGPLGSVRLLVLFRLGHLGQLGNLGHLGQQLRSQGFSL